VSVNILVSSEFIIKLLTVLLLALAQDIIISPENKFHLLYISIHSLDQSKKTSEIINSGSGFQDLVSNISHQKDNSSSSFGKIFVSSKTCQDCQSSNETQVFKSSFSQLLSKTKTSSKTCQLCQPLVITSSETSSSSVFSC